MNDPVRILAVIAAVAVLVVPYYQPSASGSLRLGSRCRLHQRHQPTALALTT
jgi:hypothetical protein